MSDTTAVTTNGNGSAAVVKYEPKKPIKSVGDAKHLLERFSSQIAQVLPQHMTPERMLKLVLVAVNRTPKLLQCTQESVIESVMRSAELGLDCSGTMGEAYLVPYGNTCQLIPGYRGLLKLARNSGEVKRIEAEVIHEHDEFEYEKGTEFKLRFKQNLRERGEAVGAYALVEFKDGGIQADYMTFEDIEKVRKMSKAGGSGPWRDHWPEMARKTVWRRLSKWAPLSSEQFNRAIEISDQEFRPTYETAHIGRGNADDINTALGLETDGDPGDPNQLTDEERAEYEAEQGKLL